VKQHQSIMQASSSMLQLLPKRRAKTRPCKDASEEAERKSSGKLWKKKVKAMICVCAPVPATARPAWHQLKEIEHMHFTRPESATKTRKKQIRAFRKTSIPTNAPEVHSGRSRSSPCLERVQTCNNAPHNISFYGISL